MKPLKVLPMGAAPLVLMSYGWFLGQLHQSGPDLAGILLFITGAFGLVLAIALYMLTRKYPWHGNWFVNFLLGVVGCVIVFILIFIYARLHG